MIDVRTYGAVPDGTTDCASAINAALLVGDIIIQNGIFLISESIKIPSNRTVYGKNASIKLANTAYDNIFRNSDFTNGNVNVKIIGLGNFCVFGNSANNYDNNSTYNLRTDNTYKYFTIAFGNINGFEISGINFVDYTRWNIVLEHCTNGEIDNLYCNSFSATKNQDGIDIMRNCSYITITNVKGYFGDDVIAVAVSTDTDSYIPVPNKFIGDTHDITIDNITVYSTSYHSFITLGGDGNKIYNFSCNDWIVNSCAYFAYFGLLTYYDIPPAKEDVTDIDFDNILVKTQSDVGAVIRALEDCQNITFTNFTNSTGKADYSEGAGLDVVDFYINGVNQS